MLRPAFSVVDAFEDRFGGLVAHLEALYDGRATIQARGLLILEGLKAQEPEKKWTLDRVKESLFEAGLWHEEQVNIEAEFIQRLLYTPEQYTKKKAKEEAERQAMEEMAQMLASSKTFSEQQPQT